MKNKYIKCVLVIVQTMGKTYNDKCRPLWYPRRSTKRGWVLRLVSSIMLLYGEIILTISVRVITYCMSKCNCQLHTLWSVCVCKPGILFRKNWLITQSSVFNCNNYIVFDRYIDYIKSSAQAKDLRPYLLSGLIFY